MAAGADGSAERAAASALAEGGGSVDLGSPGALRSIPQRRGVLAIEDVGGGSLALVSGARLRDLAARRLEGERGAGLAAEASRAVWRLAGSAFAGDLVFLEEARARSPGAYEHVADRWQGWFILGDPSGEHPTWEKVGTRRLGAMAEAGEIDPAHALGPFGTKHAAGRAMAALDDAFELCRYPEELRRAPRGRACAYKEMGRCPAACDGSEPLEAYRARVGEAIATVTVGAETVVGAREAEMHAAAEALDFEEAERLKRWVGGAAPLTGRGARWARTLERFRFAGVSRSGREGRINCGVVDI